MKKEEYVLKIIIIGTSSVGKTSLVHYYLHSSFNNYVQQTTGVEYSSKTLLKQNKIIKLQIWDTAGQERFKSITKTYYRGAVGCIVMFDLTNKKSFENSMEWYELAREVCGNNLSSVFVGNKRDLENEIELGKGFLDGFMGKNGFSYIESSCVTGFNVDNVFEVLVNDIMGKVDKNEIEVDELIKHKDYSFSKNFKGGSYSETKGGNCNC